MSFFEYYYNNILKHEFLTKYIYKNVYQLPRLDKIVLSFSFSQTSLKSLLPLLSALTLISSQKPYLVMSKRLIISLRTKSGLPVGCKVNLRGKQKFFFFEKLVFSILPRLKEFSINFRNNILFLTIPNLFAFKEIEKDYEHFSDLPKLQIAFVFRSVIKKELVDFLVAFHFSLKKRLKF